MFPQETYINKTGCAIENTPFFDEPAGFSCFFTLPGLI